MRYALATVVCLAACGKGKSKAECRAEAEEVGALLTTVAKEPHVFFQLDPDVRLAKRSDLPARALWMAPRVTLTSSGMRLDDASVEQSALRERLAEVRQQIATDPYRGRHRDEPTADLLYLVVDETAPWQSVVDTVAIAREAGFVAPAFVFEQPSHVQPPPRTKLDDTLDKIRTEVDPSNRATEFARVMEDLVKPCAPLTEAFGSVAGEPGENKAMVIARSVAPALIACNCNVKIPELRSALFSLLHVPRPLRAIHVAPGEPAERISLPPTTTWAEASKRFTPALKNAELAY